MKKRIVSIIILTLVLSLSGLTSVTFAETVEDNYRLYCSQCHGLKGNGEGIDKPEMAVGPRDHTSAEEMSKLKDSDMYIAIAQGGTAVSKSAFMPPWEGVMTDTEIKEMVKYLRKLCDCKEN